MSDYIDSVQLGSGEIYNLRDLLALLETELLDRTYPVGAIYMSVSSTSPATLFGGTWVSWGAGRVPVSVNTSDSLFNTAEKTGGYKDAIVVAHTHTLVHTHTMAHTHTGPAHTHTMAHTHTGPAHTHTMAHTHTVSAHTHTMGHVHPGPSHTHNISGNVATAGGHTHGVSGTTVSAGEHSHYTYYHASQVPNGTLKRGGPFDVSESSGKSPATTSSAGNHTHSFSATSSSAGTHDHAFSGLALASGTNNTGQASTTSTGSAGGGSTGAASATSTGSAGTGNTGGSSATNTGSAGTGNTGGSSAANTGAASATTTSSTGDAAANRNLPPYITCYMWKRTA